MKKTKYAAFAAAIMMALTGCGRIDGGSSDSKESQASAKGAETSSSAAEDSAEDSSAADASEKKPAHASIGSNGAKAVTDVLLIPEDNIDISRKVNFYDMYGVHVLHSGVVGLVGAPIEVQFDTDEVEGGKLVFVYDPEEMKGVRPDALMFMWYDDFEGNYVELEDGVLNTENCSMSIEIDKPGVYLLVNKYAWYNAWGAFLTDDGMEDGYDPSNEPISSELWAKNETVGDIPELADEEYIRSCKQTDGSYLFKVGSAEQLASAVYFVNCANPDGMYPVTIELTKDIDLKGYEWASMGWYTAGIDYDFTGVVNGNGHTIKNMYIKSNTYGYSGFIGFCTGCSVYDLNFENAYVSGRNPGIVIGYARSSYIGSCSVQGTTKGTEAGAVVGIDQSCYLENCTADVIANGKHTGDFLAGNDMATAAVAEEHGQKETLWLDDQGRPNCDNDILMEYTNLGWSIERDGEQVLDRVVTTSWLDLNETYETSFPGHYAVTLTAYVKGHYIPISNTIEFDVK